MGLAVWLAAAGTDPAPWAQYGLAGLVFSVLVWGGQRIYRDMQRELISQRDQAVKERQDCQEEIKRLNSHWQEEVKRLNTEIAQLHVPHSERVLQALKEDRDLIVAQTALIDRLERSKT